MTTLRQLNGSAQMVESINAMKTPPSNTVSAFTLLLFLQAVAVQAQSQEASSNLAWRTVSPSPIPRLEAAAAKVRGKIYLFGGFTTSYEASKRVDLYDPVKDGWTRMKDMPSAVTHLNAAVDGNNIWFAGGFKGNNPGKATDEVWKYDLLTDAWTAGPPLPESRGGGALAIARHALHFFGGFKADRNTDCADHWVLSLDDLEGWKRAADLPDARGHLGTVVIGTKIFALGGQHGHDPKPVDVNSCHVFDTMTGTWLGIAPLPINRSHFEPSAIVHNGRIIIVGGRSNSSTPPRGAVNNITEYDPKTDTWRELGALPQKLAAPVATMIGDQILVSCGGLDGTSNPQTATLIAPWPGR